MISSNYTIHLEKVIQVPPFGLVIDLVVHTLNDMYIIIFVW